MHLYCGVGDCLEKLPDRRAVRYRSCPTADVRDTLTPSPLRGRTLLNSVRRGARRCSLICHVVLHLPRSRRCTCRPYALTRNWTNLPPAAQSTREVNRDTTDVCAMRFSVPAWPCEGDFRRRVWNAIACTFQVRVASGAVSCQVYVLIRYATRAISPLDSTDRSCLSVLDCV